MPEPMSKKPRPSLSAPPRHDGHAAIFDIRFDTAFGGWYNAVLLLQKLQMGQCAYVKIECPSRSPGRCATGFSFSPSLAHDTGREAHTPVV
jgi:hypothetical protein